MSPTKLAQLLGNKMDKLTNQGMDQSSAQSSIQNLLKDSISSHSSSNGSKSMGSILRELSQNLNVTNNTPQSGRDGQDE